ncbi:hypothetical protein [Sinorhizobium terangae]|uniref:Uncharacterized protein n=1 Tax=Sinorhizobium terangae TaxID=110322 RepID=A0A6N7LMA2_SINTE|nr:hypothetical protein [Sinorhizobium terangae]MBB4189357.1 hypothetical protein [Sinorhizobium terangae]MQX18962.1 hypothetical protein [Sinorhizobium terangae]MQX19031.1 hypothetical protein [Sinorhizobium terangae]WFU49584.1 hypothetical protein QA637_09400 [Sinorhizobium terangae]
MYVNRRLDAAERRIAEGARHVLIQREIIVKLKHLGSDTSIARQLLFTFEMNLAFYIVERDRLIREMKALAGKTP